MSSILKTTLVNDITKMHPNGQQQNKKKGKIVQNVRVKYGSLHSALTQTPDATIELNSTPLRGPKTDLVLSNRHTFYPKREISQEYPFTGELVRTATKLFYRQPEMKIPCYRPTSMLQPADETKQTY